MDRGGTPARVTSFVSLMAYGPKVSDSALAMGVAASETRQGSSQHNTPLSKMDRSSKQNINKDIRKFTSNLLKHCLTVLLLL